MKVAVIPADEDQPVRIDEVKSIDLEYLQKQVAGWVEALGIPDTEVTMYLNEEGKLDGLPVNLRANRIAHRHHAVQAFDIIVGDAVIVGPVDDEGYDTGLTEDHVAWLRTEVG